jgi:hypothetical protein
VAAKAPSSTAFARSDQVDEKADFGLDRAQSHRDRLHDRVDAHDHAPLEQVEGVALSGVEGDEPDPPSASTRRIVKPTTRVALRLGRQRRRGGD